MQLSKATLALRGALLQGSRATSGVGLSTTSRLQQTQKVSQHVWGAVSRGGGACTWVGGGLAAKPAWLWQPHTTCTTLLPCFCFPAGAQDLPGDTYESFKDAAKRTGDAAAEWMTGTVAFLHSTKEIVREAELGH